MTGKTWDDIDEHVGILDGDILTRDKHWFKSQEEQDNTKTKELPVINEDTLVVDQKALDAAFKKQLNEISKLVDENKNPITEAANSIDDAPYSVSVFESYESEKDTYTRFIPNLSPAFSQMINSESLDLLLTKYSEPAKEDNIPDEPELQVKDSLTANTMRLFEPISNNKIASALDTPSVGDQEDGTTALVSKKKKKKKKKTRKSKKADEKDDERTNLEIHADTITESTDLSVSELPKMNIEGLQPQKKKDSKMDLEVEIETTLEEPIPDVIHMPFCPYYLKISSHVPERFYPGILAEVQSVQTYSLSGITRYQSNTNEAIVISMMRREDLETQLDLIPQFSKRMQSCISNLMGCFPLEKEELELLTQNWEHLLTFSQNASESSSPRSGHVLNLLIFTSRLRTLNLESNRHSDHARCFYTNKELLQIVVITARTSFAMPLLPQLLEKNFGRVELLGLKYFSAVTRNQAKQLTPYDVDDWKWKDSLDLICTESIEGQPGWISVVVRKKNAHKEVDGIASKYLDTFKKIYIETDSSQEAKRQGPQEKLTDEQALDLSVIISQSPEATFYQLNALFAEEELFSRVIDSEIQRYHPSDHRQYGDFYSFLSSPPPCLSTFVLLLQNSFSILGKVLGRARSNGFILTGLKQTRIHAAEREKMTKCESLFSKPSSQESSASKRLISKILSKIGNGETVVAISLSRENGIKHLIDTFGEPTCQVLGFYCFSDSDVLVSSSFSSAELHKSCLFPDKPAVSVISNVVHDERSLFPNWSKLTYPIPLCRRPPCTDRSRTHIPMNQGAKDIACVILTSPRHIFAENVSSWNAIIDAVFKAELEMVACRMLSCSKDIMDAYCRTLYALHPNEIGPVFASGPCLALAFEGYKMCKRLSEILASLSDNQASFALVSPDVFSAQRQVPIFFPEIYGSYKLFSKTK